MPDPISCLQLARDEIDKTFGAGFAQQHPELVAAEMQSAASDWAAARLATAIAYAPPEEERGTHGRRHAGSPVNPAGTS